MVYAAYASAGLGRKIALPFRPKRITRPIDLWKQPELVQLDVGEENPKRKQPSDYPTVPLF